MKLNTHLLKPPDGIIVTLPVAFFQERKMSPADFERYFVKVMSEEDCLWHYKLTNLPKQDVLYVYFVFDGFLQYRLNLVQYERGTEKVFNDTPDGIERYFEPTNWVICSGPAVKCPTEIQMKGFQGFRYCETIF